MNKIMSKQCLMALLYVAGNGLMWAEQSAPAANAAAHPAVVAKVVAQVQEKSQEKTVEQQKDDAVASQDKNEDSQEEKIRKLMAVAHKLMPNIMSGGTPSKDVKASKKQAEKQVDSLYGLGVDIEMKAWLWIPLMLNGYKEACKKQNDPEKLCQALLLQAAFKEASSLLIPASTHAIDTALLHSAVKSDCESQEKLSFNDVELILKDHAVQLSRDLRSKHPEAIAVTLANIVGYATCVRVYQLCNAHHVTKENLVKALEKQRNMMVSLSVPLYELIHIATDISKNDSQAAV